MSSSKSPDCSDRIPNKLVQLRHIIETSVARVFGIPAEALLSRSRGVAHVALARQVAMYLAHMIGQFPQSAVGRAFGRDRTTVSHACAVVEDRRDDPAFNLTLDYLERIVARLRVLTTPTGEWPVAHIAGTTDPSSF